MENLHTARRYVPALMPDADYLPHIYHLRALAWERSPDGDMINRGLYPAGWTDALDATATHWIICNEVGDLIASARLNVLTDLNELLPVEEYTSYVIEIGKPIACMSRLVTHPDYRNLGLSHEMDKVRIAFAEAGSVRSMVGIAGDLGISRLEKLGFVHRFSFLDKTYTTNPRGARSHLMVLDIESRAI